MLHMLTISLNNFLGHDFTNDFVITGMDRHFPGLALRTGLGTELTVTISRGSSTRKFELYRDYAPGTLIEVKLLPLYKIFF
jgi:hypothetical protein